MRLPPPKYCRSASLHTPSTVNRCLSSFSRRLQASIRAPALKQSINRSPLRHFVSSKVLGISSISKTECGQRQSPNIFAARTLLIQIKSNFPKLSRNRALSDSFAMEPQGSWKEESNHHFNRCRNPEGGTCSVLTL